MYAGIAHKAREKEAIRLLKQVGLGHRLESTPSELSGGEQQRVAIARALLNKPSIILADEPTGALDSKTGDEVMGLLETLHQDGVTIIMVTHEQYIAEYADRIIYLKDGKVVDHDILLARGQHHV
jgi:putative ABC transport system ATP-binding protein